MYLAVSEAEFRGTQVSSARSYRRIKTLLQRPHWA